MATAGTENAPVSESESHVRVITRVARVGSPVTLALAFVLFLLPFLSVSCDAPGGYGRMSPGGTTTYTGLDLAMGSLPSVDNKHLRPAAEQQSDDLGVQPLVTLAALGALAAVVLPLVSARRRRLTAPLSALSALLLVVVTLLARATLVDRVAEHATVPFPTGKSAGDYVRWGIGFWIVFALIALGAALGAIGARREPDRLHAGGP
jgi:hypothetical protein